MTENIEERERYRELLEELRTILPGAQVLFAFLLTVPFSARFADVDLVGRIVFAASLVGVAAATLLFFAPASYHRLVDRTDRRGRIQYGIKTTLAGLALLALSIDGVIFVVMRFMFGNTAAAIIAGAVGAVSLAALYLYPFLSRE